MTPRSARALEEAGNLTGDSKTDTINRSIQVYAYMEQVLHQGGRIPVREEGKDQLVELKIF